MTDVDVASAITFGLTYLYYKSIKKNEQKQKIRQRRWWMLKNHRNRTSNEINFIDRKMNLSQNVADTKDDIHDNEIKREHIVDPHHSRVKLEDAFMCDTLAEPIITSDFVCPVLGHDAVVKDELEEVVLKEELSEEANECTREAARMDNLNIISLAQDGTDAGSALRSGLLESSSPNQKRHYEGDDEDLQYSDDSEFNDSISSSDSEVDGTAFNNPQLNDTDRSSNNLLPTSSPFKFTGTPGLTFDADAIGTTTTPLDFFSLFFDDDLFDLICRETNRFAEQEGAIWTPVTSAEMRVFIALKMLQGIVKKPSEEMYWTKNVLLETPIFAAIMPFRRYKKIREFLHFSNNETYNPDTHPNRKLNKIYDVYLDLDHKFRTLYHPDRDIALDESLKHYKQNIGWVQYVPIERCRFGMKCYMLCESKTGYVWSFLMYVGKETKLDPDFANLSVTSQVVMSLVKPLLKKGYCLTVDHFYIRPQLIDTLSQNQTNICCKIRQNQREMPERLKKVKLKENEAFTFEKGSIKTPKDRKEDTLPEKDTKTRKEVKERVKNRESKVTRFQHLSDPTAPRQSGKKYYKKIFYHLMDLAIWNSYILYKSTLTDPASVLTPLKFRMELVDNIIQNHHHELPPTKSGRPSTSPHPTRFAPGHFPIEIPPTGKKLKPTRQCFVCTKKRNNSGSKVRKESRYMCEICKVSLCISPCFKIYHTN